MGKKEKDEEEARRSNEKGKRKMTRSRRIDGEGRATDRRRGYRLLHGKERDIDYDVFRDAEVGIAPSKKESTIRTS